jgi:inorganic pyrophosphatase
LISFDHVRIGNNPPNDVNVVVEISRGSNIKYEIDREMGILTVDRKLYTSMFYPGNYGFIPQTLAGDGDAEDVLVLGELIIPTAVINTRPIGVLITQDEKGEDSKIIAVPSSQVDQTMSEVNDIWDINPNLRNEVEHFFMHHKELEEGKFVKIIEWKNKAHALEMISHSISRYRDNDGKLAV